MRSGPIDLAKYSTYTIIVAFVLTWIFDVFEQLIKELKIRNKAIMFMVKDFTCVVIYCLSLIIILYYFNQGVFRGIYIVGIFLGAYFYFMIFAKILRKLSRLILMPLIYVIALVIKFVRKIATFLLLTIEKIYLRLYNRIKSCKS